MLSRLAASLLVGLVPLAGCRGQLRDAYIIEAFSAEVRVLEDQLYEFDHRLDRLERRLESQSARTSLDDERPRPAPTPPPASSPRRSAPRDVPPVDVPDLTPPDIEPGVPASPDHLEPEDADDDFGALSAIGARPVSRRGRGPLDPRVARIEISPFTRVADFDDVPGIDGVELIVVPFNADGDIVAPQGEMKVVVLDPAQEERLFVGEFDAGATKARFRLDGAHSGIHIQGPFSVPPSQDELHVYVRLVGPDGERIETDGPLRMKAPTRVAERWI